jgi:hypothetical protein
LEYGDEDVLGTGSYGSDPKAGATLEGSPAGTNTFATPITGHGFRSPLKSGEFGGTDQVYVGSVQTGASDGYSVSPQRVNGPQVLTLDYSSLVPAGNSVLTLTLGIAADDFQNQAFGQAFSALVNGLAAPALTAVLNGLDQTGPVVQFFTIGLNPSLDNPTHVLTLSIDQGGDGSDGWAVDYLTLGVTSQPSAVPEPASMLLLAIGLAALGNSPHARPSSTSRPLSAPLRRGLLFLRACRA